MNAVLRRIRTKFKILEAALTSLQEAQTLLKQSQTELKQIRKVAESLREAFLDRLIGAMNITDDTTRSRIRKHIQKAEDIKKIFRKLRFQRRTHKSNGIATIDVPIKPEANAKTWKGAWRQVSTPDEIEEALLARNRKHFGQADGTPFTTVEYKEKLGYQGNGPISELIITGDTAATANATDEVQKLFINHLQQKNSANSISTTVTLDQFKSKITNWPEATSTSPSGIHLK